VTLTLTVTVQYDPGTDLDAAKRQLEHAGRHLAEEGLLSGDYLDVSEYAVTVQEGGPT
jgi:hypothetical protein